MIFFYCPADKRSFYLHLDLDQVNPCVHDSNYNHFNLHVHHISNAVHSTQT